MYDRFRVLVIDDDPGVRDYMEALVSRQGYEVFAVADGEQGLHFRTHFRGYWERVRLLGHPIEELLFRRVNIIPKDGIILHTKARACAHNPMESGNSEPPRTVCDPEPRHVSRS